MRKLRPLSFFLLAILFIAVGCTKEGPEGPVGATGAQGPPGTPGAVGATGQTGATGPAGTANVIYSSWFAFAQPDWIDTTFSAYGVGTRALKSNITSLTQAVVDQGVVLGYTNLGGVVPLPAHLPNPNLGTLELGYFIAPTKIIFYIADVLFGDPAGSFYYTGQIRYVIIPGGVAGGRMISGVANGYTVEQLRAMPYEEVLRKFNIPQDGTNIK